MYLMNALPFILAIKSSPTQAINWYLGANINPCDGKNFGYAGPWNDNTDVGNEQQAFTDDYLDNEVWHMAVGYITIVRHNDGICEMSKTWELSSKYKSM